MITKKEIKLKIEGALDSLRKAEDDLRETMSLLVDTGNRIELAGTQALLKRVIEKTEDLIYPKVDILEIFAIVDGDNRIVGKYSEVNHE